MKTPIRTQNSMEMATAATAVVATMTASRRSGGAYRSPVGKVWNSPWRRSDA